MNIDTEILMIASGWIVAFGEVIWLKWKRMPAKTKGEIIDEINEALSDGRITPEEAMSIIESFFTGDTENGKDQE